jgi:hypothetical protein
MSAFDSALRTCRTFRCMPFPALDCHHDGRRWMRALRPREERCLKYILTRENNSRRVAGIEEGEPVRYALNVAQKRFRPPTAMANQISCIALFAERKDPTTPVKCRYLTLQVAFVRLRLACDAVNMASSQKHWMRSCKLQLMRQITIGYDGSLFWTPKGTRSPTCDSTLPNRK